MFEVKLYSGASLAEGGKAALDARLWVPGWMLHRRLVDYSKGFLTIGEIAIGFLDGEAVCIVCHDNNQAMAFCKKALRGNGYTSQCVAKFTNKHLSAEEGTKGSIQFWKKNGVYCRDTSRYTNWVWQ